MFHSGERWCDLGAVALLRAPRMQDQFPQLGYYLGSSWVLFDGLPLASSPHAISDIGLGHSSTPSGRGASQVYHVPRRNRLLLDQQEDSEGLFGATKAYWRRPIWPELG